MLQNRTIEFWVWYPGRHGGHFKEVATTEDAKERIVQRLRRRGIRVRVQKYYRVN